MRKQGMLAGMVILILVIGMSGFVATWSDIPLGSVGMQGHKDVTTAGTPVRLSDTSVVCYGVAITADGNNTGRIAFGFSNAVRAATGGEVGPSLGAGESVFIPINDARKTWIDAAVNGEGVGFACTRG